MFVQHQEKQEQINELILILNHIYKINNILNIKNESTDTLENGKVVYDKINKEYVLKIDNEILRGNMCNISNKYESKKIIDCKNGDNCEIENCKFFHKGRNGEIKNKD